jgi:hypothetical protein
MNRSLKPSSWPGGREPQGESAALRQSRQRWRTPMLFGENRKEFDNKSPDGDRPRIGLKAEAKK